MYIGTHKEPHNEPRTTLAEDAIDWALLDGWQRDFPFTSRPFATIGWALGLSEQQVMARLRALQERGFISRIGAVVQPNTVGASTLAALSAPRARLEEVAEIISRQPAVTHNYEREHALNLWFVVAAPNRAAVAETLARIERQTGLTVLNLPLVRAFHIDLGFALPGARRAHQPHNAGSAECNVCAGRRGDGQDGRAARTATAFDRALLAAIEDGLALTPRPFAEVARRLDCTEDVVISRLAALKAAGIIRRFGVVVRHRRLGFRANGMVVWDIPDAQVARAGELLARAAGVTLCYQRRRQLPAWPYNLFCMIHGRARDAVRRRVRELAEMLGDVLGQQVRHEVLFSRRCFKQRGARFS